MFQHLTKKMSIRTLLYVTVTVAELCVSIVVHLGYALWIIGTVLLMDVVGWLTEEHHKRSSKVIPLLVSAFPSPVDGNLVQLSEVSYSMRDESKHFAGPPADAHVKAPIVLVHGIFGFGKGVRNSRHPQHAF